MTRCIHFPFIVLLVVWRNQSILGSDVDLVVRDATCVGNNVTLKCTINPFTTVPSATWSRNGSNALTTCTSGGPCTQDDLTIDGVKYSFSGGSTGIQVAFQIQLVENGIEWICSHNATPYRYTFEVNTCPISQMSTSIATERTTSINSISELSNITLPMISGSTTTTNAISASTSSFLNTRTTNFHSNTETTHFYAKTETTTSYANTETSNLNANIETTYFDANTQTNKIQTNTLRTISNSSSTYQKMFVTTAANDLSGSFEIPMQIMTETFAVPSYTMSSYNEIISPSTFETSTVFPQTVSATSISLSVDTLSDSLLHTLRVSSGSLIAIDSSEFSILSMTISPSYDGDSNIASLSTLFSVPSLTSDTTDSAFDITNVSRVSNFSVTTDTVLTPITTATVDSSAIHTVLNSKNSESLLLSISENNSRIQQIDTNTGSPLMSTTFIDQMSYSSKIEEPSFSSYQYLTETIVTLPKINVSSQLPLSIIDTMNHFIYTTNTMITSFLDDTRHSYVNFTNVFQAFSRDYAASASTSLPNVIQSTDHHSSLQTTEYHAKMQTEFTSNVTTSFYESNTDNATTGIYSKKIVTSAKFYMHTSVMPSQTQLASMNDIQDSTTDFQSTYLESYFQSTDVVFSSKISEYLLSTLQSKSFLLPFNTNANAPRVDSYMKTTNMLIRETQSGMLTISAILSDFETTMLTTTIDFNDETILSMIKPSSQQTNTDNSYIAIDTSFKDSLFSSRLFFGSLTSYYAVMTTSSSMVFESKSTISTSTVQSGLSEKNKIIIFISTTSAVVTIIVVILLIIFARINMSKHNKKPRQEDDNISWSNYSSPPKTVFPDFSFTGKSIYPLLNTSSTSFKMHPYEQNWNDIV